MNSLLQRLMKEATRLTRSGNLHAATEAIQRALHGQLPGTQGTQGKNTAGSPFPPMAIPRNTPRPPGAAVQDDTVVDGYMRFVDDPVDTGTDAGGRGDAASGAAATGAASTAP